jgi:hypothetical protein
VRSLARSSAGSRAPLILCVASRLGRPVQGRWSKVAGAWKRCCHTKPCRAWGLCCA